MNFTSQICTTKEQSERLLILGLNPNTADMVILEHPRKEGRYFYTAKEDANWFGLPAWSLHRLIEMIPSKVNNRKFGCNGNNCYYIELTSSSYNRRSFAKPDKTLYDNIIDCIEWLIKESYFNKEYLN